MRKFLIKLWVGFFILGWLGMTAWGFLYAETGEKSVSSSRPNTYASHELLIQFKSEIKLDPSQLLYPKLSSGLFQLDSLNSFFQTREIIPLMAFKKDSSTSIEQSTISQIYLFKFANVWSLSKLKKTYESLDIVEFVEFNYHYFADHSKSKNYSSLLQSQLEEAARYLNPNHSVIIGTIDTGIDWQNQKLKANAWYNRLEKLDGKDNDANGFVDDLWGWNFVDEELMSQFGFGWENHPIDYSGHGNQIGEIINQIVNYSALNNDGKIKNQLMILKAGILSPNDKILFSAFGSAQAIIYAADNGARVINLPWNGNFPSQVLQQAIDYAVNRGCVIISSAGDNSSSVPHYPAAYENVWAVTATNDDDKKLNESNYGHWIDISAPGLTQENFSSSDSTQFIPSGTAIAAANVSGLAGLLLSCENIGASDSLKRRIIWSSENIYHKNPEYSGKLGAGRINVLRAINSQHQPNVIITKLSYNLRNRAQYLPAIDIVSITISIKNLSSAAKDISIKLTTDDPYLTVLKSEITLSYLDFQQEFANVFDPFTLIISNDCPPEHEAKLSVSITTSNGFSLEQSFTFTNLIMLPEDLTIINNSPLTLRWAANPEFIGYHIYRKDDKQQIYARISEIPIVNSTYIDPTTKPGVQYFYYVTGIDSSGWESPSSNVVTFKRREAPKFLFYPTQDTLISDQDSIIFIINPIFDDLSFQWFINDDRDSLQTKNLYTFQPPIDSSGSAIVSVTIGFNDTTYSHQWLITILNRNRSPEILSHSLPTDTTIAIEDTLEFFVATFDPDQDSLSYRWYINHRMDTAAVDSFYTFFKIENWYESDTISVQISDNDTAIFHHWIVHYFAELNEIPQIISCSPSIDSMLTRADSILFNIHCNDPDGDTLQFTWSLNGWIDTSAHDSTYWYRNLDSTITNDTLNVNIADADTAIELEWILWAETLESASSLRSITYFPEQDSLIAEGDSLIFLVQNANDSYRFQWKINSQTDSIANDSIFVYHLSQDSIAIDTIHVTVFDQDSLFSHQWYIHYFNFAGNPPSLPLRLAFKPEQDVIFASAEDSLKFSVQILEGEFADLNFQWSINKQLDTTAIDAIFYYNFESFLTPPDTVQLIVSRSDTTISHQWILQFHQQQTLPVPHLVFPIEGNHICEDDKLIWENDSSLAQIDSTGAWNYVVQISSDTTFSTLISTDSCATVSIALNDLSGFERISIGKPIYWRVKVFSGHDKISEFNKCDLPFSYYSQFARLENFYGQKNEDGTIDLFWTTGYESNCAGFNVYRCESQDDNFEKVNEYLITGQTNYSFQDIKTNAGKTYYYKLEDVSLNGKKKFHHTISITTPIPAKFSLSQNYPNPFNAKTSFKYEIPTTSRVKIEVCNVLGRKVKTLVNEQKEAGFYTVYWDGIDDQGENVVSGIYFYSLITNKGKLTRKMVVVR